MYLAVDVDGLRGLEHDGHLLGAVARQPLVALGEEEGEVGAELGLLRLDGVPALDEVACGVTGRGALQTGKKRQSC